MSRRRLGIFAGLSVASGLIAGVIWWAVTPLATYTVQTDGTPRTSERGLAEFFAGDAWYAGLGLVGGLLLGVLAWRWFGRTSWRVVPVTALLAAIGGLVCWGLGTLLGPGTLAPRLAAARPGDVVPIELTLRSPSAVLVWVVAAVTPLLIGSTLGRDPEDGVVTEPATEELT